MPRKAATIVLLAITYFTGAVPVRAEHSLPANEEPLGKPRRSLSLVVRAPLALAAGGAVTLGGVIVIARLYTGGEGSTEGSVVESLFWLTGLSVAAGTAVYSVESPLDGGRGGSYGFAIGGAALGTIVMAATLSNSDGAAAGASLFAPALGAIVGYELTRRGPAPAVLTIDKARFALGVPLPQPRVIAQRGRRGLAFEAPLLTVRF